MLKGEGLCQTVLSNPLLTNRPSSIAVQMHKAVIIEGRIHHALSFVCRKTLLHLGPDWGMQVFHSRMNHKFVHQVLLQAVGVGQTAKGVTYKALALSYL
jgi:hypothetical protein